MASSAITPQKFQEVVRSFQGAQKKLATIKQKGEEQVGHVMAGLEIAGTELGLGYARGRFGEKEVGGIPVEVLGSGLCIGLGLSGIAGKHGEHLINIGSAGFGFVAAVEGIKMGQEARARANPKREERRPEPQREERRPAPSNETRVSGAPAERRRNEAPRSLPDSRTRVVTEGQSTPMAEDIAAEKETGT